MRLGTRQGPPRTKRSGPCALGGAGQLETPTASLASAARAVCAALREGAGWERIAAALDRTPAEAWDAYLALVEEQGGDGDAAAAARELAGARPAG